MSPDCPAAPEPRELSAEQREQLQQVIERELTRAWRTALAAGADPAALAEVVTDRAEALRSAAGLTDDAEHLADDPLHGTGVGEQG